MAYLWDYFIGRTWFQYPLVIFYAYVLYALQRSKNKSLHSNFFLIFKITGVLDVIVCAGLIYHSAQHAFGFGYYVPWLTNLTIGWSGAHHYTHFLGGLLMDLFQYTGIRHPILHMKFWSRRMALTFMAVIVVFSYICNSFAFLATFKWELRNGTTNEWAFKGGVEDIYLIRLMNCGIVSLYQVASLLLAIGTLKAVSEIPFEEVKANISDRGLAFFSLTNSMLTIYEWIYEFTSALYIENEFVFFIWKYINAYLFILLVHNSISIVVLSKTVRKEIMSRWLSEDNRVFVAITATKPVGSSQSITARSSTK